jgi:hypothetical protein
MKKLLSILFLLPLFAIAQDCTLKKQVDPISSEPNLVTGFVPFNSGGVQFAISMEAGPREINLFFLIENPNPCFKDESTAVAYFEGDRSKVNLKNIGGSNCQGIFQAMYKNTPITAANLERLSQKKIASFRFKLTIDDDKLIVVTLNPTQQQQLTDMFLCIIKQSKTLIKK